MSACLLFPDLRTTSQSNISSNFFIDNSFFFSLSAVLWYAHMYANYSSCGDFRKSRLRVLKFDVPYIKRQFRGFTIILKIYILKETDIVASRSISATQENLIIGMMAFQIFLNVFLSVRKIDFRSLYVISTAPTLCLVYIFNTTLRVRIV